MVRPLTHRALAYRRAGGDAFGAHALHPYDRDGAEWACRDPRRPPGARRRPLSDQARARRRAARRGRRHRRRSRPTERGAARSLARRRGMARDRAGARRQRRLARVDRPPGAGATRLYGDRVGRRVRELAPRPRSQARGRRRRRRRAARGCAARRARRSRSRPRPRLAGSVEIATSPGLADAMQRAPDRSRATRYRHELEVIVERRLAACSAWYELFPRSTGTENTHGTLRRRRGAPALRRRARLRRPLPAADPPDRRSRSARDPNNAPSAGPEDPGSPWAIGTRRGRPQRASIPQLGTLDDFARFVATRPRHGLEVALDIAFQASPDHPWCASTRSGFGAAPTGRSSTPRTRRRNIRTSTRSTSRAADWRALWEALRDVVRFWCEHGVRDLPRGQSAHEAVRVLGMADRRDRRATIPM